MFDMMGMLGKAREMQNKLQEAKERLVDITVTGEAGAGLVEVKANGHKQVLSIAIDETLLAHENIQLLQTLLVSATNHALQKAEEEASLAIKQATEGLIPNIPGMDFGKMFS
jgi:nucleoid-associated protein EbfC